MSCAIFVICGPVPSFASLEGNRIYRGRQRCSVKLADRRERKMMYRYDVVGDHVGRKHAC